MFFFVRLKVINKKWNSFRLGWGWQYHGGNVLIGIVATI